MLIWRGLLGLVSAGCSVFLALNLAALALGQSQPQHLALVGFREGCEAVASPCWYGIVPGKTPLAAIDQLLLAKGYTRTSRAHYTAPIPELCDVHVLDLPPSIALECRRTRVHLGDMMVALGQPNSVINYAINKYLAFDGLIDAWVRGRGWLNPFSPVHMFVRSQPTIPGGFRRRLSPAERYLWGNRAWHGFVPYWRYCQLEPGYLRCSQFPP
jgi:hypothetical protein